MERKSKKKDRAVNLDEVAGYACRTAQSPVHVKQLSEYCDILQVRLSLFHCLDGLQQSLEAPDARLVGFL